MSFLPSRSDTMTVCLQPTDRQTDRQPSKQTKKKAPHTHNQTSKIYFDGHHQSSRAVASAWRWDKREAIRGFAIARYLVALVLGNSTNDG